MVQMLKKFLIGCVVIGIVWFFSAHHLVIFGKKIKLLKKKEFTFSETFVSTKTDKLTTVKALLRKHPESRRDGLGDLLVEMGMLTDERLIEIEDELEE